MYTGNRKGGTRCWSVGASADYKVRFDEWRSHAGRGRLSRGHPDVGRGRTGGTARPPGSLRRAGGGRDVPSVPVPAQRGEPRGRRASGATGTGGRGTQASCKLLLTKIPFKTQRRVPCSAQHTRAGPSLAPRRAAAQPGAATRWGPGAELSPAGRDRAPAPRRARRKTWGPGRAWGCGLPAVGASQRSVRSAVSSGTRCVCVDRRDVHLVVASLLGRLVALLLIFFFFLFFLLVFFFSFFFF